MKTNFELVKEFHKAFNKIPDPDHPTYISKDVIALRFKLMKEEFREVLVEMGIWVFDQHGLSAGWSENYEFNATKLAKELADLLYVVYGTAASYGIPIDEVYREVHESNMSKLGEDGKPIYREDGKVLKGPNYRQADIESIIRRHMDGKNTNN